MHDERWYGLPPPPQRDKPKRMPGWLLFLGLMVLVVLAVGTYVMLQRLDDTTLAILATVGCAAGVALPTALVAVVVLLKRAENSGQQNHTPLQPTMTQPTLVVVPPMALPQQPAQPQVQTLWDQQPVTRKFTIVGDGGID